MAKAKAKAKGKAAPKAAAQEMLLVASKVRSAVKAADCNFGGDALEALNAYVGWIIAQATKRAAANGRKTVRGADILVM
jgi:histone H3/H4